MQTIVRTLIQTSLALAAIGFAAGAQAQAVPTARQSLALSAWGGLSGTFVGLNDGRNLALSAGGDVTFRRYFGVNPSVEVRGSYPVDSGSVAGERTIEAGLKAGRSFGRLHPYAGIFFGRGQLNYIVPLPNATFTYFYAQTTSNIVGPAIGFDIDVTRTLALKADAQLEHWSTPVTASGHIFSEPITAGVVYRFDLNGRRHFPTR